MSNAAKVLVNGAPISSGNPLPISLDVGFTEGSVIFRGATGFAEDNTSFFWDDANNRLGIGLDAPLTKVHIANGDAGAITPANETILTVENDGNTFLSLLSPDASSRGLIFGEPANERAGGLFFNDPTSPDGLVIRTGGNTNRMEIDSSGNVLQPTNTSFLGVSTVQANITGSSQVATVKFATVIRNIGSDFDGATGIYEAPVNGHYDLAYTLRIGNIQASHNIYEAKIVTDNRVYVSFDCHPFNVSRAGLVGHSAAIMADMDAGDEAKITIDVRGTPTTIDIASAAGNFSGSLIN